MVRFFQKEIGHSIILWAIQKKKKMNELTRHEKKIIFFN